MPQREKLPVSLSQNVDYILPADLKYVGLAAPQGAETVRIRFSRGVGTRLDFPLSQETLCDLIRTLHPLFGTVAEDLPAQLADYRKTGKLRFDD